MKDELTEERVNEFLRVSLKTYLALKKTKRDELAHAILSYSSTLANINLDLIGAKKNYHKVYCPICKKQLTNGKEIEFLNQTGACAQCEHIRGDILADQLNEMCPPSENV